MFTVQGNEIRFVTEETIIVPEPFKIEKLSYFDAYVLYTLLPTACGFGWRICVLLQGKERRRQVLKSIKYCQKKLEPYEPGKVIECLKLPLKRCVKQ